MLSIFSCYLFLSLLYFFFFFKQKTAYEMPKCLEFRRVLFRSGVAQHVAQDRCAGIAIVGAGEAGAAILRDMLGNPGAGLVPVAVLDDDPRAQGRKLMGDRKSVG